jgi:hypothetical protein
MPREATSGPGGSPTRKKAKSKAKTKKTPTVQSNLMFRVDRNKYLGQLLLMDESIYDGKVPEQVKGKLFLYKKREYTRCGKQIIVEYMGKVIDGDGGDAFSAWKEGTADDQLMPIDIRDRFKQLKEGIELYYDRQSRVKMKEHAKNAATTKKDEEKMDVDVCVDDINELYKYKESMDQLYMVDFEILRTQQYKGTDKGESVDKWKRELRHKLMLESPTTFGQPQRSGSDKYDTGKLTRFLKMIKDTRMTHVSYVCARHILTLAGILKRNSIGTVSMVVSKRYKLDQSLPADTKAAMFKAETGVPVNIF